MGRYQLHDSLRRLGIHPWDRSLPALLAYAEGVARSRPAALDQPDSVTQKEDSALLKLARELHVDRGESWTRLLDELR